MRLAGSSASASPTTKFSLDHKQQSRKRNQKKWKCSDPSNSDSVKLLTPLTTPIFDFHKVIRSLTTPTLTPSLVKASLKRHKKHPRPFLGNPLSSGFKSKSQKILFVSKFIAVAEAGKKGDELTKMFFKEEYMLNYAIGKLYCVN